MRAIPLALLALTLGACNAAYRLPEGATQTAKVRFSSPDARLGNSLGVYSLSSEDSCMDAKKLRHLGGWQMGGISEKDLDIGMLKVPGVDYGKNQYVEVPVVAEQRANFALQGLSGGQTCHLTLSFLPKADRQYEVNFFTSGPKCYGGVYELVPASGAVRLERETSAKLNGKTCTTFWN